MKILNVDPTAVASYYLQKATDDGDLITNLKMQKLVYYAYSWILALHGQKLFNEPIEAWPNGPVVPSLYRQLNKYGASPIKNNFIQKNIDEKLGVLSKSIKYTLDSVYATYIPLSAFELVSLTHNELPWKNAREGLSPTQRSNNSIDDKDIIEYFTKL